jgi:hypothetical protein
MALLAGCKGTALQSGGTAAALQIAGAPTTTVTVGSQYALQPSATAPAGSTVGYSITHKPHWASFSTMSGLLAGVPQSPDVGTYPDIVISASDGSGSASLPAFSLTVKAASPPNAGSVARPAYNRGNGFFVLAGKLYDGNGSEFRIRGVNRNHWDSNSEAGIARSGANAVRTFIDFSRAAAANVSLIQTQNIDQKEVPIVTYNGDRFGLTSCSSDPAALSRALSAWTSQAPLWSTLDRYLIDLPGVCRTS